VLAATFLLDEPVGLPGADDADPNDVDGPRLMLRRLGFFLGRRDLSDDDGGGGSTR